MMTKIKTSSGFTLIEMMTSVSIFIIVMTISMGAVLGIFNANEKVGTLKAVMDNLNFAVETMSREIRFGSRYHCGAGSVTLPANCSGGSGLRMAFLSNDETQTIVYQRGSTNNIEKSIDGGVTYTSVTAPEVQI